LKVFSHVLSVLVLSFILIFISACGYKPSSKFARSVVGEKVSTSVVISLEDPENTVLVKDAVDSAIIETFHASLVSRVESDTHLVLSISSPSYSPIVYDSNGYVVGYRMTITLNITRTHNGVSKAYSASGNYDFTVSPNAVITDQERFDAIRFGAQKAILAFVAQVSAEGARAKKKK
jgi:hypothetical protein